MNSNCTEFVFLHCLTLYVVLLVWSEASVDCSCPPVALQFLRNQNPKYEVYCMCPEDRK